MGSTFSRRDLLRLGASAGAAVGLGALVTACSPGDDGGPTNAGGESSTGSGKQLTSVDQFALTPEQVDDIKGRKLRFGYLINNISDDFSKTLAASGEKFAGDYGIELTVNSGDFDANKQLSQFNALVEQRVNGIFLTAVDAASIGAGVVRANQAKIPVFIVGGPPGRGEVASVMNAASYDGCKEAAAALMKTIGKPNATVAVLGIPFALQTIRDREKGVLDAVGAAGGQVVSLQSDFNQDKLLTLATNVIQANPDLGGIFGTWSLAVNAIIQAVQQSGRQIPFAGYDAEATGYQALASGNTNLVALSAQQPYLQGKAAIEGLCQVILGNTLAPEIITPNLLVTKENYRDQWKAQYPESTAPF